MEKSGIIGMLGLIHKCLNFKILIMTEEQLNQYRLNEKH